MVDKQIRNDTPLALATSSVSTPMTKATDLANADARESHARKTTSDQEDKTDNASEVTTATTDSGDTTSELAGRAPDTTPVGIQQEPGAPQPRASVPSAVNMDLVQDKKTRKGGNKNHQQSQTQVQWTKIRSWHSRRPSKTHNR